jgi:simple sugar transport system ATP-binding protein
VTPDQHRSDRGAPAIEVRDIVKRFPGVVANDGISFSVPAGTIHAIVGENGAGKSTLMKILYGMQPPDEGVVRVRGLEVHLKSPKEAIALGIGMVHQHFMLADNFTVLENVILGSEPTSGLVIDEATARERIVALSDSYGLHVDPDQRVESLGVGERQRVEILKVLYRGATILILDEPTAVLVPQEVDHLFDSLRELVSEGVTVLFISHKLDEVLSVADDITVIRAGRTVAEVRAADVTAAQLAELMVGSELPTPETTESTVTDRTLLDVRDLVVRDPDDGRVVVDGVTLTVHAGEIVGVAGVLGNGQSELVQALVGVLPVETGTIELLGRDVTAESTHVRREMGIGYVPEDRSREGLLLPEPLWENTALGHQRQEPFSRGPWLDRRGARRRTEDVVRDFDVRTPSIEVSAAALSGGNQQKLIFGREMLAEPKVLLASQPTRGIDVGAQAAIWDELRQARSLGLGVLLVSADLEELIGLSDTLLVLLRGRLVAELDPATVVPAELGAYMTGVALGGDAPSDAAPAGAPLGAGPLEGAR